MGLSILSRRYCGRYEPTRRRFRAGAFIAATLVLGLSGCGSFEHLTRVTEEFPKAKECGKCHVNILQEWSVSDHAAAYVNPHYRRSTDDYEFDECHGCHAPQPMVSETPPTARSIHRSEGITCVSCHLEEARLSGPIEPTGKVAPHPVGVRPEFYKGCAICGNCHEGTLAEWQSVTDRDKKSCQDCHMSPVKRKVTQATGGLSNVIVAFEKEVSQKRHDFAILSSGFAEQPVSFETRRSGSDIVLIARNNLPHALPTGDFGYRVLVMAVFAPDPTGSMIPLGEREFAKELGNAIEPRGAAEWQLALPPETRMIRVHVRRQSYEGDPVLSLMDVEVPLP